MFDTNFWIDFWGLECQPRDKRGRFLPQNADDTMPGKDYETFIENKLRNNPKVEVIGTQITVHTPDGIRYVDILIKNKKSHKLIAIEIKSGKARRNRSQIIKDLHICSGRGKFGASAYLINRLNETSQQSIDGYVNNCVKPLSCHSFSLA